MKPMSVVRLAAVDHATKEKPPRPTRAEGGRKRGTSLDDILEPRGEGSSVGSTPPPTPPVAPTKDQSPRQTRRSASEPASRSGTGENISGAAEALGMKPASVTVAMSPPMKQQPSWSSGSSSRSTSSSYTSSSSSFRSSYSSSVSSSGGFDLLEKAMAAEEQAAAATKIQVAPSMHPSFLPFFSTCRSSPVA